MIYWQLFYTFLKIGTFTLGGGYAMIPLIQAEVVDRRKWISEDEFLNMLALAQSAPGIIAVNTAIFIGYSIRGWRGVICTILGAVLPSFCIILLIAAVFTRYRDLPEVEAVMKGVRPAVVALIAAPLWRMAKSAGMIPTKEKTSKDHKEWLRLLLLTIPVAAALLIWLVDFSPIWIILITITVAILITYINQTRHKQS